MMDNLIIDIPELRLPRDMAWRASMFPRGEAGSGNRALQASVWKPTSTQGVSTKSPYTHLCHSERSEESSWTYIV